MKFVLHHLHWNSIGALLIAGMTRRMEYSEKSLVQCTYRNQTNMTNCQSISFNDREREREEAKLRHLYRSAFWFNLWPSERNICSSDWCAEYNLVNIYRIYHKTQTSWAHKKSWHAYQLVYWVHFYFCQNQQCYIRTKWLQQQIIWNSLLSENTIMTINPMAIKQRLCITSPTGLVSQCTKFSKH